MPIVAPAGDLARAITHEADQDWPHVIEIRAKWRTKAGGFRFRSVEINADEFFGRGAFGAPMGGDALISAVDRLRRQGPSK